MKIKIALVIVIAMIVCDVKAREFAGPAQWQVVHTNAVKEWQRGNLKGADQNLLVLNGVVGDKRNGEVRLLAEAVGHSIGTVVEFLLIGPASDRAYEAVAVTVGSPDDIVKAMEHVGFTRGRCVSGINFQFVPFGERFQFYLRSLADSGSETNLFTSVLREESTDDAPLLSKDGFVFAGGEWREQGGLSVCRTATEPPCSVISLYNELSIFDLPRQAGQSAVYGRLTMQQHLAYGDLIEIIIRPVSSEPRAQLLKIKTVVDEGEPKLHIQNQALKLDRTDTLKDTVLWLREQVQSGMELFVELDFDQDLTVRQAAETASVFDLLAGAGVNLYGKAQNSVYYRAFLPHQDWRKREGRNPQPFELHITRDADGNLSKRFIYIEEDWNVEGLDPKLNPREFPFNAWDELPTLLTDSVGQENKIKILFVFVPRDLRLRDFMQGINILSDRLPLVHIFID